MKLGDTKPGDVLLVDVVIDGKAHRIECTRTGKIGDHVMLSPFVRLVLPPETEVERIRERCVVYAPRGREVDPVKG